MLRAVNHGTVCQPLTLLKTSRMPEREETENFTDGGHWIQNSLLYREFEAERQEIMKHKWIESEKAGRDIGFETALTDWILKHRNNWRRGREKVQRGIA